jgi:hypothetical protein
MPRLQRFNIKAMLANPDLRRKLIVEGTRAAQAREGVEVSAKEAENSYYVVTEAERAAFFALSTFRTGSGDYDGRHIEFINTLGDLGSSTRIEVGLRDFASIDDAPLAYDRIHLVAHIFRDQPSLDPTYASAVQGLATANDARFIRFFWEIPFNQGENSSRWFPFAKGGGYCRFYSDVVRVIFWENDGFAVRAFEGSVIRNPRFYFKPGLTWSQRNQRGFSMRRLPEGCVFAHVGSVAIPHKVGDADYLLAVMNSTMAEFLLRCFSSFGAWEVGAVRKVPIPSSAESRRTALGSLAADLHTAKAEWDTGNETSTRFESPWILQGSIIDGVETFFLALDAVVSAEPLLDRKLQATYTELNDAVYKLYGVNDAIRRKIETAIGPRPPEIIWPQMEGKSIEQKRLEHVNRLLTYLVKRIVDADNDGLVCLQAVAQERPLQDRLREELHRSFPHQDPSALETEVVNELKKKVKGCRRVETLNEWLNDAFFEIHANLYQQRPLLWHLASSQTRSVPAFSVVVHAHKFDGDALAKLRSVHIRDRLAILRREAGQARQDNREEDRLEFLAAIEEVEAFDAKLKLLQEGAHTGPEGGDRDYRILTPWKSESERPQGWNPDLDDGIKVNIAPLARTGLLRIKGRFGEKDLED